MESFTASADALHSKTMDADMSEIGAHYFAALGTRILAGRDLRNDDDHAHSCIVNERAAAMYFGSSALSLQVGRLDSTQVIVPSSLGTVYRPFSRSVFPAQQFED
jgi:hypothetical protein